MKRALLLGLLFWAQPVAAQDAGVPDLAGASARDGHVDGAGDLGVVPDAGPNMAALVQMVDDAVDGLARTRNREGLRAFKREDYPAALRAFREAHDLAPKDAEITNNLAFLYERLGDRAAAERFYKITIRLAPRRSITYVNLADLLMQPDASPAQLQAAWERLARARQLRGNDWKIIRRQARVAMRLTRLEAAQRLFVEAYEGGGGSAVALEFGDYFRSAGQVEDALIWYRRVHDAALAERVAERIVEVQIDLQARRYGWQAPAMEASAEVRAAVERATVLLEQGKLKAAVSMLRDATEQAPTFAGAHHRLALARLAQKNRAGAELSFLRALVMAPTDADLLADFAAFLRTAKRPAEAAWFLRRAVEQRPDWRDLQLRLAQAWQAAGEPARALRRVELYLAALPEDAPKETADALRRALQAALPAAAKASPVQADQSRAVVGRALAQARSALAAGQAGEAMALLANLKPEPPVLNLQGRILLATGRSPEAATAFAASLAIRAQQPAILEQHAVALQSLQDWAGARTQLLAAEAQGSVTAGLAVARLDARRSTSRWPQMMHDLPRWADLQGARARLSRYLAAGAPGGAADEAQTLLNALNTRIRTIWLSLSGVLLLLLALLLVLWMRVWGGLGLGTLVQRHPEAGPEVQRVLSAIRHEVLKHNTMVLTGLADAIEARDPFAEEAAWCRRSLLGAPGARNTQSAHTRLKGYAAQLSRLGRAHGVRLNLRRKDPALSALLHGFRVLQRAAPLLDRAQRLGATGRGRLLRALRLAARRLNVQGYEAVRALLDQLRVLDLDPDLLTTIFDRTRHEPAFADQPVEGLELQIADDALPSAVVVPRYAFDDMLANLLRNGIQSAARHCPAGAPIHIKLALEIEVDFITGLQRVVFRIYDRSPQPLTPEMLRGRYIEAGLGLTADLVSRYEGTLDVEAAAPPWQKAVVLKLPRHDMD